MPAIQNTLSQLQQYTTIVADTGNLAAIKTYQPLEATTNPSLITQAAKLDENIALVQQALQIAEDEGLANEQLIERAIDILTVALGAQILKIIPGRVSTEVDAALSFDQDATINKAHELIKLYQQQGIDKQRILIKIAATWQGIQAAKILEQQGIHCNLTLVFNLEQAALCAENGITLISPFVGRILDWYKKNKQCEHYPIEQDPGVLSVKQIYHYYKQHQYNTQIMGASFRSPEQVIALAGCDLLTISPTILQQLNEQTTPIEPTLSTAFALQAEPIAQLKHDQASFQQSLEQDPMANELLNSGIDGFVKARSELQTQLRSILEK